MLWCNNLSELEVLNLNMNRSGFEYYKRVASEEFVRQFNPHDCRGLIYIRLTTLLSRLDGPLPEEYVADIPEGW